MKESQILKEHQISEQTPITNECQILKDYQIYNETQIANNPKFQKKLKL